MPLIHKLSALAIAGALAVGACGGDDGDDATAAGLPPAPSPPSAPPTTEVGQLTGYTTRITLAPRFRATLRSLGVTPRAVGGATLSPAGVATFPITGGTLSFYAPGTASPYVRGVIDHDGSGLELEAGGTRVELAGFTVDPGTSALTGQVSVDGTLVTSSAALLALDGATLRPLRLNADGSKAVLEGARVQLEQEAAELLDQAFGSDDLTGGLEVGVAKITVNTR